MKKLLAIFQFLPVTVFLGVARHHGFVNEAWPLAFQYGALAAVIETAILLPLLKNQFSRLIAGANLFLVLGGVGFYFNVTFLMNMIDNLRETAILLSVALFCLLGILFTSTGVFENQFSKINTASEGSIKSLPEKKYSVYFLIGIGIAIYWSLEHRGDPVQGGTLPFIALIFLKQMLQRRLTNI